MNTLAPVAAPTDATSFPTSMNPTLKPSYAPSIITETPTVHPTDFPTPLTLPPTHQQIMIYSPKPGDTIVCTNKHETCIIDCSTYQQCKRINTKVVRAFIGSPNVIINCNNIDSCFGAEFYIGLPQGVPLPPKTKISDLIGTKDEVQIHCNKDSSCKQTIIQINGEYRQNAYISAYGNDGLKNADILCNNINNICQLNCIHDSSCVEVTFKCNSYQCTCHGYTCPELNTVQPTPKTQNPTTYSPTIATFSPTNKPIKPITESPTFRHVIYYNISPKKKFYNTIYFYILVGIGLIVIICLNITFCYHKKQEKEGRFEPLVLKKKSPNNSDNSNDIAMPNYYPSKRKSNPNTIVDGKRYNTFSDQNLDLSESWGI